MLDLEAPVQHGRGEIADARLVVRHLQGEAEGAQRQVSQPARGDAHLGPGGRAGLPGNAGVHARQFHIAGTVGEPGVLQPGVKAAQGARLPLGGKARMARGRPFGKAEPRQPGLHPFPHGGGQIEALGDEAPVGRLPAPPVPEQRCGEGTQLRHVEPRLIDRQRHLGQRPLRRHAHAGLAPPGRPAQLPAGPVRRGAPAPVLARPFGLGGHGDVHPLPGDRPVPAGEAQAAHGELELRPVAVGHEVQVHLPLRLPGAQALDEGRPGDGVGPGDGQFQAPLGRTVRERERQGRPLGGGRRRRSAWPAPGCPPDLPARALDAVRIEPEV